MMKKCFIALAFAGMMIMPVESSAGVFDFLKKKPKTVQADTTAKKTDYDKFIESKHETAKGMITLHLKKGKVYFELPVKLIGREMLIGSTITEVSNNAAAIVGSKPQQPLHIFFTREGKNVQLRDAGNDYDLDGASSEIAKAIKKSTVGAIIKNIKIEHFSNDSSSVVFDMTDFFVSNNKKMLPFDDNGYYWMYGYNRSESFKSDQSFINGIKSFEDNASITSTLSYEYNLTDRNGNPVMSKVPYTAVVTRSIILLDEKPYRPRIGDSRMSVFPTAKYGVESQTEGIRLKWFSNRWRLEPSDPEAYKAGQLVEPVKKIVFYVDSNFPEQWKSPIKEAVNQWNEMFETIGFKNAIEGRDFPTKEEDPSFDPDNLKYSCIRYAPIGIENAMGPSWTDPRSGEILTASVYVYHNVAKLLRDWIFVQTSPADERVRHKDLPAEVFEDGLRYIVAHEIGHCLGFMHNMSASYQVPVDSLRSPSYTNRYGTTKSIMDYARYNYVAQPGDRERGVKLTPPRFGEYDQYAVKWLYSAFPGSTADEEKSVLLNWLKEAYENHEYEYGKQQIYSVDDPRSQTEDLGDDAVKASAYGIENLKYIVANCNSWVEAEDEDGEFRVGIYNEIVSQYVMYINHIYGNIGGLYINDVRPGDGKEYYDVVPKEYQKKALKFICSQIGNLDWLDNKELLASLPVMGSAARLLERSLCDAIAYAPFKTTRFGELGEGNYTFEECSQDVFDFVWKKAKSGRKPSSSEMYLQEQYVKTLVISSGVAAKASSQPRGITDGAWEPCLHVAAPEGFSSHSVYHCAADASPVSGYGSPRMSFMGMRPYNKNGVLFGFLSRSRQILKNAAASATGEVKAHYQYLYDYIANSLENR